MIHQVILVAYLVADQVPNSTFLLHTRGLLVLRALEKFSPDTYFVSPFQITEL